MNVDFILKYQSSTRHDLREASMDKHWGLIKNLLKRGPKSAVEIGRHLGMHSLTVQSFMDGLEALGKVRQTAHMNYILTEESS
jgi:DNA-binding IclR family transcriptional regulator